MQIYLCYLPKKLQKAILMRLFRPYCGWQQRVQERRSLCTKSATEIVMRKCMTTLLTLYSTGRVRYLAAPRNMLKKVTTKCNFAILALWLMPEIIYKRGCNGHLSCNGRHLNSCTITCCHLYCPMKQTRLKRLPVISREHFRKTRTNYQLVYLCGILNTNLQNGISNTSA
jgi:hypothetical protein